MVIHYEEALYQVYAPLRLYLCIQYIRRARCISSTSATTNTPTAEVRTPRGRSTWSNCRSLRRRKVSLRGARRAPSRPTARRCRTPERRPWDCRRRPPRPRRRSCSIWKGPRQWPRLPRRRPGRRPPRSWVGPSRRPPQLCATLPDQARTCSALLRAVFQSSVSFGDVHY